MATETDSRRDEILLRMLNTPHKQQKAKGGGAKAKASRKRKAKGRA